MIVTVPFVITGILGLVYQSVGRIHVSLPRLPTIVSPAHLLWLPLSAVSSPVSKSSRWDPTECVYVIQGSHW